MSMHSGPVNKFLSESKVKNKIVITNIIYELNHVYYFCGGEIENHLTRIGYRCIASFKKGKRLFTFILPEWALSCAIVFRN